MDSDPFAVAILSHITWSRHEAVRPGYHVRWPGIALPNMIPDKCDKRLTVVLHSGGLTLTKHLVKLDQNDAPQ